MPVKAKPTKAKGLSKGKVAAGPAKNVKSKEPEAKAPAPSAVAAASSGSMSSWESVSATSSVPPASSSLASGTAMFAGILALDSKEDKKQAGGGNAKKKKVHRRRKYDAFLPAIRALLVDIQTKDKTEPKNQFRIREKAVNAVASLCATFFEELCQCLGRLFHHQRKDKSILARKLLTSALNMCVHTKYLRNDMLDDADSTMRVYVNNRSVDYKKGEGGPNARSGLILSVPRIYRDMKLYTGVERIGTDARIKVTAVMQTFMWTILVQALRFMRMFHHTAKYIREVDLIQAVRRDAELRHMFPDLISSKANAIGVFADGDSFLARPPRDVIQKN